MITPQQRAMFLNEVRWAQARGFKYETAVTFNVNAIANATNHPLGGEWERELRAELDRIAKEATQ